jgi:hypothetical protein
MTGYRYTDISFPFSSALSVTTSYKSNIPQTMDNVQHSVSIISSLLCFVTIFQVRKIISGTTEVCDG